MADKDQLQSSINKLDNTMNALDKTVKGLTKAFNDMNRTEKSRKATSTVDDNRMERNLRLALEKYGPHKKDGSLYKDYEKAIDKLINSNKDFLIKYDKIREQGYNKDNPSNKIKDVYGIKEVQKRVDEILSDLSNLKRGSISKEDSKAIREELYGNTKGVSVDNAYKFIQAMDGGSDAILRTAGIFAQVRSEVVAFQSAIQSATKTVTDNLSGSSKRVNTRLSKMAADSKTLKDVVANLSSTVTRANNAVDRFTDRLNTASALISANNRRLNGSVMSMNTLVKKVQKTSNTITNIQNTLSRKNTASSSGGGNSFREQATRNSDRAKQAGFIALLIPALAKLLKKTPITDLFRLLALRLGSGLSGAGEHPVAGAIGLAAAPLATGALFSATFRKTLGSIGSKILGLPEIAKTSKELKKITSGFRGIPMKNWGQYTRGIVDGLKSPRNLYGRQQMLLKKGYATKVAGTAYRDPLNKMRWLHKLQPETGMVAGNQGVKVGQQLQRMFTRPSANLLGANALGRTPVGAAASKGIIKRIPILGTAISAAFEIPDLIKAHKSGDKKLMGAQVAKSVGGVTGGTIGAIAGGALGSLVGPIGTVVGGAVGGVLGDFVGRHLGSFFRTIFTGQKEGNKMFNTFGETMMEMAGLQAAEHPILTKVLDIINPIPNLVLWIWNKIKGWTFGGESNSNGGAAKDKADKESNKLVENVDKKNKELEELKVGGKEYNKLWKKYHQQYEGALKRKGGLYFSDEDREALKYESADKYAIAKIVAKIKEKEHELAVSKSNLSNAVNIDKDQLVNANDLYTWSKSKVEEELKKRTGAYEKLQDKKGYWTVNHGSFVTDVEYAGKGTQNTLQRMVDDHVLPAGFSITSAMGSGEINKYTGKKGHSKNGGHYNPLGNAMDITYSDKKMWEVAMNGGVWNGVKYTGLNKAKGTYLKNVIDERAGQAGNKYARMGENTHLEFATTTLTDSVKAFQAEEKAKEQAATVTTTKEETASSEIRKGLADIVGAKNKSDKQERARNVIFSAVDVTGSLGVWGITQLNNGVMRTGR